MRSLVEFDAEGKVSKAPAVGSETIFSENYLLDRPTPTTSKTSLVVGGLITVESMVFRIDSIGDYVDLVSEKTYPITVYYCTRTA